MLMIRGDMTRFELEGGRSIRLKKNFGMVHDPTGRIANRCDVYLCEYTIDMDHSLKLSPTMRKVVNGYFGSDARVVRALVEIPSGPWQRLGVVETIYYARYGKHEGPWYHPFEDTEPQVELYKSRSCDAYKLQIPNGCIINDHGFVWP